LAVLEACCEGDAKGAFVEPQRHDLSVLVLVLAEGAADDAI
jgi:hypothetical protein